MKIFCNVLLVTIFFVTVNAGAPPAEKFAVIINSENTVKNLSVSEVKLYYLRKLKKRWTEINKNIRPVDRKKACPERDAFYSAVLNMTAVEVETYFTNRQLQNAERPPDKFSSDAEVIDFVSSEAGAIGYVNLKSLSAENQNKVRIVLEF